MVQLNFPATILYTAATLFSIIRHIWKTKRLKLKDRFHGVLLDLFSFQPPVSALHEGPHIVKENK